MKYVDAGRQWHIPRVLWGGGGDTGPARLHYAGANGSKTLCGVVGDGYTAHVALSSRHAVSCASCLAVVRLVMTGHALP